MASRIESDRHAGTGFAVKDTPPEMNARLFSAMMRKTPQERLLMGFDMMATARKLAWKARARRRKNARSFQRWHGMPLPPGL
ncbi:MAG TPA: hypothetical protein DIT64_00575 [Verrucomicrobiales bacterium]|nr:hypothetical protein [Verrucomicrobiales bacterium]HRJ10459.1 hypothetical protein [Prosthecobacter sp.]HRK17002.1 hypothetical protein [Prosthecobacter sp.]